MNRKIVRWCAGASFAAMAVQTPAAMAQDDGLEAALDALSSAAEDPASALETASAQEAQGDLLGAASTLERALLENPDADEVRANYARILCRIDDRDAARVEIGALRGRYPSSNAIERMIAECGDDFRPATRSAGGIRGNIAAGIAFQEDALGELLILFPGTPDADGLSFTASAQVEGRAPIGDTTFVFGELFALNNTDISGPDNDYQFGDVVFGFGGGGDSIEFTGGAVIRHARVLGGEFFTAYGGVIELRIDTSERSRLIASIEGVEEDFVFDGLDGSHFTFQGGMQFFPSSTASVFVGGVYETKQAEFEDLGYDAIGLQAGATVEIGSNGAYSQLSTTLRRVRFEEVPLFTDRRETRFFARAAVGVPVFGDNLFLEGAVSYRARDYNVEFFADNYNSVGAEARLVWRF